MEHEFDTASKACILNWVNEKTKIGFLGKELSPDEIMEVFKKTPGSESPFMLLDYKCAQRGNTVKVNAAIQNR